MTTKPFTTPAQQVALIKEKGFVVDDAQKCEKFFERNNYYRVSAFLLPFRRSNGTYIANSSFQKVLSIDTFDSKIRNLLTRAIEQ
ncbi:MAG: Abi family protein [Anaerolineaceae bacterium]|nr:Abi family protein [Anaerolineaceae bacterium]